MTIRYVTLEEVATYHDLLLQAERQPPAALMSPAKLESAILRAQSEAFGEEFYPTLAEKAAVLIQGIVVAHAFLDGNKRAGLAAMLLFLELNGILNAARPRRPLRLRDRRHDGRTARSRGDCRPVARVVRAPSRLSPRCSALAVRYGFTVIWVREDHSRH